MAEKGVKFASRWGFILAAVGGAVGLGNIWRFTFMAGENGGGAFIFLYFVFILFLGLPCLMAMIVIGRRGAESPVGSTRNLAIAEGRSENWRVIGYIAITIAFLVLSFFSMIAGWILAYLPISLSGAFAEITADESVQLFGDIQASALGMTFWHAVFMCMTIFIVARGVQQGLEKTVQLMMPALAVLLLILVAYGSIVGDLGAALRFMFVPDFSRVDNDVVLLALGQAFFSLSVGGGGILAYGAYLQKDASIPRAAFAIAGANVSVDMLAGLAIFPIVFASALEPAQGPGLIFVTLPVALGQMPGGQLIGTAFLILVLFAALTSSISMLESIVSRLVERPGATRLRMTLIAGGGAWFIGLGSVFSHNIWSDFTPLDFIPWFEGSTIFRIIDFFVVNNLMLISAFLITIFAGWVMSQSATQDELGLGDSLGYKWWRIVMRFLAPLSIFLIAVVTILSY